jgi:hypothetical protein
MRPRPRLRARLHFRVARLFMRSKSSRGQPSEVGGVPTDQGWEGLTAQDLAKDGVVPGIAPKGLGAPRAFNTRPGPPPSDWPG